MSSLKKEKTRAPKLAARIGLQSMLFAMGMVVAGCGAGTTQNTSTTPLPQAAITWAAPSVDLLATPGQKKNVDISITLDRTVSSFALQLSPNLQPYIQSSQQIAGLKAGTSQIPVTVSLPDTAAITEIAGSLTATADGATSTLNVYLRTWPLGIVPQTYLRIPVPPNTIPHTVGNTSVYSDQSAQSTSDPGEFSVSMLDNPQALDIASYLSKQQQDEAQANVYPVLTPYQLAQGGIETVSVAGANEAIIFWSLPEYREVDDAYIRVGTSIFLVANTGLDSSTFRQMIAGAIFQP